MSKERRERIAELAWKQRALKIRKNIIPKLVELDEYEFLDMKTSMEMGGQFWDMAEKHSYENPGDWKGSLRGLSQLYKSQRVIWLHRYTNEAGAIVVNLDTLANMIEQLQGDFGPDILIADLNFEFGFCFEEGESEFHLRLWGLNGNKMD